MRGPGEVFNEVDAAGFGNAQNFCSKIILFIFFVAADRGYGEHDDSIFMM